MCVCSPFQVIRHQVCKLAEQLTSMCPPKHVWLAIILSCIKPWEGGYAAKISHMDWQNLFLLQTAIFAFVQDCQCVQRLIVDAGSQPSGVILLLHLTEVSYLSDGLSFNVINLSAVSSKLGPDIGQFFVCSLLSWSLLFFVQKSLRSQWWNNVGYDMNIFYFLVENIYPLSHFDT